MDYKNYIFPLIALFASLLFTCIAMPWLLKFCKKRGLYDVPDERKVHSNNIPRLGGSLFVPAMLVGMSVALFFMNQQSDGLPFIKVSTFLIFTGILIIYLIGLLDDLLGLPARFKFIVQFIAALFLPCCGLYINNMYGLFGLYELPMYIAYPITIFLNLLIVNSINLIDGIDGLASGISVVALIAYLILFSTLGVVSYTVFAAALIGAVVVFMYYNLFGNIEKGTKTFMGDTGSLILGYALAYLSIKYAMYNPNVLPDRPYALIMAFTFLIIPVFDLTRVAFTRLLNKKSIFHPDKTHIHHLCMQAGLSMRWTLVIILCLQVLFVLVNYVFIKFCIPSTLILLIDIIIFATFIIVVKKNRKLESSK